MNKNTQTFLGCDSDYAPADTVLFGVPFDGTTSYRPGARFGSRAVRSESFGIETYSPFQQRDLCEFSVFDAGDLELPFGSTVRALKTVETFVDGVMADGKLPFLVGGEHLVTLGAVRAAVRRYPDLCVVHLDAHADLRNDYLGETLSHATVMRRVWEMLGDGRLFQFGIRSGEREEFEFAAAHTSMTPFTLDGLAETLEDLRDRPVYFSLDLDVLDPSVFPGTGTPEPGGMAFCALQEAVSKLSGLSHLVGCDVVELSPVYDQSGISTAAACKLIREMLIATGCAQERRAGGTQQQKGV